MSFIPVMFFSVKEGGIVMTADTVSFELLKLATIKLFELCAVSDNTAVFFRLFTGKTIYRWALI
jgi:hypothetical protein